MATDVGKINVNFNQNLWGLVVGFSTLGASEYYDLCTLYWFAVFVCMVMVVSILFTTIAYTVNYWKLKLNL